MLGASHRWVAAAAASLVLLAAGPAAAAPVPPPRLNAPTAGGYDGGTDRPSALGLTRLEDGSYAYVDPAQQFTLTILADGRVRFADRWRRPSAEDSQHGVSGGRPAEGAMAALNPFSGIKMGGPLEWMLRTGGHDLATSSKVRILRQTEEFRIKLAIAWTRTNVSQRLRALPGDLERLWKDTSIPAAKRREILFEHWDACEDRLGINTQGIPASAVVVVDRERLAAAHKARALIVRFIQRQIDAQSQDAYRPAELEALNARRVSVEPFVPYQESPQ